jgi:predicted Zn-dependent protease
VSRSPSAGPAAAVVVGESELRRLHEELTRPVTADGTAWDALAARGWCRHLLGDIPGAAADLKKARDLQPDQPGLWALLGTVCVKQRRLGEAEAVRARLDSWKEVDVTVWHTLEASVCHDEGDTAAERWHRDHLPQR